MAKYKYPFIEDKTLYAATMAACSMYRDTHDEKSAVDIFSKRYHVEADKLAKCVRERLDAEKGIDANGVDKKGRKYQWFIIQTIREDSFPFRQRTVGDFRVIRALSAKTAQFQGCNESSAEAPENPRSTRDLWFTFNEVLSGPFFSELAARRFLESQKKLLFAELKERKPHLYERHEQS